MRFPGFLYGAKTAPSPICTVTYNGETLSGYEATQKQRAIERKIRESKRKLIAFDEGIKQTKGVEKGEFQMRYAFEGKRLSKLNAELDDFVSQTGMQKQYDRARVQGFDASAARNAAQGGRRLLTNANGDVILKVKRTEISFAPNSITQVVNAKGGIDRNYYDADGRQIKQISNNDHDKPKYHSFGKNGEHAHDYFYDEKGKLVHGPARELTAEERKENSDIL